MINVTNLTFRYANSDSSALSDLSFECDSSGIIVAVGRSGIGKSTLIALLAGMFLHGESTVDTFVGTISIDGLRPDQLRCPSIVSWVPQSPLLLKHLSVLENIVLPMSIPGSNAPDLNAARDKAKELLKKMNMDGMEKLRPRELSGGMKTRVSLLRAMISSPKYLFLDEPFTGLDIVNRWNIYKTIRELRSEAGQTTFLTTHDIPEATVVADRILLIQEKTNQTTATVIENSPISLHSYKEMENLDAARTAAVPIEKHLFAHMSPDDPSAPVH